jgi:hypothetical protein
LTYYSQAGNELEITKTSKGFLIEHKNQKPNTSSPVILVSEKELEYIKDLGGIIEK